MSHYFFAVPLPSEVKDHLNQLSDALRKKLDYGYWTDRADFHVTLVFLGAAEPDQLSSITEKLLALKAFTHPIQLSLKGFGTFGKKERPRVLWMGIESDHLLSELQTTVKECVAKSGMQTESRDYRPHITIAKKWRGENQLSQYDWPTILPTFQPVSWQAKEFQLFQVRPENVPRYKPIQTFSLI